MTSRKKNLSLSVKEYTKVTGTIASVRRSRLPSPDGHVHVASREPSFIAETSFVRAPLNSRVVSATANGLARQDDLTHIPLDIQEAFLLEDLLYVLMGIEGTYITFHPDSSPEDDDPLQGTQFIVSPSLDPSLRDLVERIIPLGTFYTAISAFIESRSHLDFGLVNHALCAEMREMLKDYQTLLSQLEHAFNTSPQFSLQKLWFYVHPTVHSLSLIYQLVLELGSTDDPSSNLSSSGSSDQEEDARNEALGLGNKAILKDLERAKSTTTSTADVPIKGGEVLSIIYDRIQNMSGDPTAAAIHMRLFHAAGAPYVAMLKRWVVSGRLVDPYEEFMVKEGKRMDRGMLEQDYMDEYWERRYTLRDGSTPTSTSPASRTATKRPHHQTGVPAPRTLDGRLPGGACIPPFLDGWKHRILLAGKYLNVIRECGIEVGGSQKATSSEEGNEELEMDNEKFYNFLQHAYTHANHTLLTLLLRDQHLLPRLRSIKRYFFLSQSSFLTHLLDLAHTELRKSAKGASVQKLQSLLELALNTDNGTHGEGESEEGRDYREDVKVVMAGSGLYEWLLKVVSVSGGIGEEGTHEGDDENSRKEREREREKEDKKPMLAIDALALDYHVPFPLSLVISRKTILRYQLLFRFLLHLKHVEQALASMWVEQMAYTPWRVPVHATRAASSSPGPFIPSSLSRPASSLSHQSAAPSPSPSPSPFSVALPNPSSEWSTSFERWRNRVFLLRTRMLSFVQQILTFATFEVLEPNWRRLENKLEKLGRAGTVDELLRDHVDFLDTCLKECMLTSSKLLRAYSRLIVTCSTFALYTSSFTKSANQAIAAATTDNPDGVGDTAMAKRWEFLGKFETNFNHWFKVHLDCVQFYASSENVSLLPLVLRLSSIRTAS